MNKILFFAALCIGFFALIPQNTFAHVLISDNTKSIGTVLHIVPDDNPVAGEQARLYFDIQTQEIDKESAVLIIKNVQNNEVSDVAVNVSDSSVSANYTFPTQGVYALSLTIASDKTYTFNYSQRVSKGTANDVYSKPNSPLATGLLIFAIVSFMALLLVAFNNRKDIKEHSTF